LEQKFVIDEGEGFVRFDQGPEVGSQVGRKYKITLRASEDTEEARIRIDG
jgi:hypothetical protein